ncbi:hypothetical protein K3495_g4001 [Podosphaera aphanis]|nr:hypothetical protein K3495_g4001 [Podosphaera aphanis]
MALPSTVDHLDYIMNVSYRICKRITLVLGKSNWTASEWANQLLERLLLADWGLSKVILSDRDPKVLPAIWSSIFTRLGVKLIYAAAYHPQTDGASERTNQTVKIAIRYYFAACDDKPRCIEWPRALPMIQATFNNSSKMFRRWPNEIVYGFSPSLIIEPSSIVYSPPSKVGIEDCLDMAAMSAKFYYDRKHTAAYLQPGDWVNLRLHRGYNIPNI